MMKFSTAVLASVAAVSANFVTGFKSPFVAWVEKSIKAPVPKANKPTNNPKENIFENELGAQAPLGFWDPLGIVADGDKEKFDRLRYVELKHGRVCMLAFVGYLATEAGLRVPAFSDLPAGFDAITSIPSAGFQQVIVFIGLLETEVMKDVTGKAEFDGDFRNGFIDFGWETFDEQTKMEKRAIELNQGRAAMMGILALMVHEKLGVPIVPFPKL